MTVIKSSLDFTYPVRYQLGRYFRSSDLFLYLRLPLLLWWKCQKAFVVQIKHCVISQYILYLSRCIDWSEISPSPRQKWNSNLVNFQIPFITLKTSIIVHLKVLLNNLNKSLNRECDLCKNKTKYFDLNFAK